MKNKKIILISLLTLGVILLITGIIITISGTTKSNKEEKESLIKQKFNNLIEATSYKIKLEELEKNDIINEYYTNNEMNFSFHFKENYESIETNFINDNYYNYKGKQIFSTETNDREIVWFYGNDGYYNKEANYKTLFLELLKALSNEEYQKENNQYINNQNKSNINEYLSKVYDLGTGVQKLKDENRVKYNFIIDNIEINLNNNDISTITFNFNQSCKIDYPDECTKTKKLMLTFSDINKINPTLPEDVQKSLDKTVAGNWVGMYRYEKTCENCDNPILEEKTITLTDEFLHFNGRGWRLECFSTSDKSFNRDIESYYIEGNKIYFIDHFAKIIEQGHIYEDKIELLDKNGNVKEIYMKH